MSRGRLRGAFGDAATAHAAAATAVPYPAPRPVGIPPPVAGFGAGPGQLGGPSYASWGLRLGGYLIDVVIFLVVNFVLGALFRQERNVLVLHHVMTNSRDGASSAR